MYALHNIHTIHVIYLAFKRNLYVIYTLHLYVDLSTIFVRRQLNGISTDTDTYFIR